MRQADRLAVKDDALDRGLADCRRDLPERGRPVARHAGPKPRHTGFGQCEFVFRGPKGTSVVITTVGEGANAFPARPVRPSRAARD
jgi:hypothetical protein